MISSRKATKALAGVAIPLLLALSYPLSRRIDDLSAQVQPGPDVLNISSGRLIKKMSLGYDALLADIYWTRVVQYYGGKRYTHDVNLPLMEPLLNIAVTLDPNLVVAYRYGAMFLSEGPPRGAGRPESGADLLRRGIAANPDEWRLWHDLGFLYYWDMKDYKKATEAYWEGSKHPQAAIWMKVMAARIAQEGRTRDTSRFLWQRVLDSAQNPDIRKNAQEHLMGLKAEEDAERLQPLVEEFHRRAGRFPVSTAEMARAGLLPGIPLDPAGFPYQIGADGRIYLDPKSPADSPILSKKN